MRPFSSSIFVDPPLLRDVVMVSVILQTPHLTSFQRNLLAQRDYYGSCYPELGENSAPLIFIPVDPPQIHAVLNSKIVI
jgi:hypothetical protein